MRNFKQNLKKILRLVLLAKEKESIEDALVRRKYQLISKLPHKKYDYDDLKQHLILLGIVRGDCIMVHASWRSFIGFKGTPQDVINILIELVGPEGTILMPANGDHKSSTFDPETSPNLSGVISKIFCSEYSAIRSRGSHFSVAAKGRLQHDIISNHMESTYGFDDFSPYGIFSKVKNSKVLLLGLGNKPTKISLFHRVGFELKDNDYFSNIFIEGPKVSVIDSLNQVKICPTIKRYGVKNSKKNIRHIYKLIPCRNELKLGVLDLISIDTELSLETGLDCAKKGLYMYSNK
ncbi:AAC(3) family N-acetyltransferase [Photobacterium sanguinicancri]|uniref:AAC(3) family N-acetyltransferase n=1 Tax=Photobacterium sanguinicancri TaxID=875932 RepID=UPI003D097268